MKEKAGLRLGFAGLGALGFLRPLIALANGGDIHMGAQPTGLSFALAWGVGALIGLAFLWFLIQWALGSREKRGKDGG